jgi:hypothetical protein
LRVNSFFIKSRTTKLMFCDFKDDSLFFNTDSCLFLVEREIVELNSIRDAEEVAKEIIEFDAIRDANEVVNVTTKILKSSFFSSDIDSSMIRFSIVKSFAMRSLIEDVIILRCFEFFFAFVVALMTRIVNFSMYLFSQFLDQFIEIVRKSSTIFIK